MSEHKLIHVEMRGPYGYVLTPACTCGWYSPNGSHLAFERHVRDAADGGQPVSTFRDAIATAVHVPAVTNISDDYDVANTVLEMPEMEAIRQQLALMAHSLATGCNDDVNHGRAGRPPKPYEQTLRWWLSDHLPDDVIAWVLGGDQ